MIAVKVTPERIDVSCSACGAGMDVPNKGLGRAMVAAWKTQHQHLDKP